MVACFHFVRIRPYSSVFVRIRPYSSGCVRFDEIEKEVLAHETAQKWLDGNAPKKVIVVPGKIVNVVI